MIGREVEGVSEAVLGLLPKTSASEYYSGNHLSQWVGNFFFQSLLHKLTIAPPGLPGDSTIET